MRYGFTNDALCIEFVCFDNDLSNGIVIPNPFKRKQSDKSIAKAYAALDRLFRLIREVIRKECYQVLFLNVSD